ncbi:T-lymphocyte surface antigen Ly-9-like [Pagrus major]|uniref:T-lymphocyte surface antigen Ly-9-like n=1 Tax=Pagrus major TaxID=143350 RepID=UPI003CC8AB77
MEKRITFWLGAVLLWAALDCSQAGVIPSYFVVGGNLELRPTVTETITNILWKYNGNLLAEWVKDEVELTYYDKYNGRTTLDPVSGRLEVTKMIKGDQGLYTVEINNRVHDQSYDVKSITKVPKPSVVVRTLTCNPESESCLLSCDGKDPETLKEAEPIEYSWKMGDKDWEKKTKDVTITSAETGQDKTITCRMKNPVSEQDSETVTNPMYKEPVITGLGSGMIAGIVFGLLLILALVVVFVLLWKFKPDLIARLICQRRRGIDIESPGGKELVSPDAQPNDTPETKLLNKSETEPLNTPDAQPNNTPDAQPNNKPDAQLNNPPDAQLNNTPEAQPNNKPDAQPNNKPDAQPNNTPDTEPPNPPGPATDPPAS